MELSLFYGILTGLIPSLHPNNLVSFISKDKLLEVAIVHSFINIIPNIYFLIPDVYTIKSLNASQKLFKEGKAFVALTFSAFGSLFGGLLSLFFYYFPMIFFYLSKLKLITYFLFSVFILISILSKRGIKKLIALILLLDSFLLIKINYLLTKDLFLPLIGYFGLSSLLTFSHKNVYQESSIIEILKTFDLDTLRRILIFSLVGVVLAIPANVFPLTTPTHFLLFLLLFLNINLYDSIVLVSSMSTADFVLSAITKEYFSYSRNFVISNADFSFSFLFFIKMIMISFLLLILIGYLINILNNILPRKLLVFLILLSIFWPFLINQNIYFLFIILTTSLLGFLSLKFEIERINLFNGYFLFYFTR